jgi:HJR/Mrr/RecB family endonuclease
MAPKAEKHAIFDAQTPIFWTQTLAPRRMMELNKALEAIGDKSPQPHRWRWV